MYGAYLAREGYAEDALRELRAARELEQIEAEWLELQRQLEGLTT